MSMNCNGMKNFTLRWNLNAIVKIELDAIGVCVIRLCHVYWLRRATQESNADRCTFFFLSQLLRIMNSVVPT